VDWAGIALIAVALAVVTAIVVGTVMLGINFGRRPRKPTRIRRAKGEYQPPEPPEGREWG
jgi:hypothetical protein